MAWVLAESSGAQFVPSHCTGGSVLDISAVIGWNAFAQLPVADYVRFNLQYGSEFAHTAGKVDGSFQRGNGFRAFVHSPIITYRDNEINTYRVGVSTHFVWTI
jgi:hypothetical protein